MIRRPIFFKTKQHFPFPLPPFCNKKKNTRETTHTKKCQDRRGWLAPRSHDTHGRREESVWEWASLSGLSELLFWGNSKPKATAFQDSVRREQWSRSLYFSANICWPISYAARLSIIQLQATHSQQAASAAAGYPFLIWFGRYFFILHSFLFFSLSLLCFCRLNLSLSFVYGHHISRS